MNGIDIAVVIVSYKSANLVIDCLRSIEAERATPSMRIRALVVDGASGDVPAIAAAVEANRWSSWVTVFEAPRNGGFAYGNNLGIQRAYDDGPPAYIHLLNPDTIVRKGGISALVRFLEAHPDVGIAGSSCENADGSDWPYAFHFPSLLSELGPATRLLRRWAVLREMGDKPLPVDWVGGASLLIRRQVFDAIGGLDQRFFLYREETDFCLRARRAGFSTWYVPESRIMHLGQQSTGAAKEGEPPRRLPAFWFASRRHYFAANYGVPYAMAVDVVALVAHSIAYVKRIVRRRSKLGIPYFLADLLRHSIWWPRNREHATVRQIPRFSTPVAEPATVAGAPVEATLAKAQSNFHASAG